MDRRNLTEIMQGMPAYEIYIVLNLNSVKSKKMFIHVLVLVQSLHVITVLYLLCIKEFKNTDEKTLNKYKQKRLIWNLLLCMKYSYFY